VTQAARFPAAGSAAAGPADSSPVEAGLGARLLSFVMEQFPFATAAVRKAWTRTAGKDHEPRALCEAVKQVLARELELHVDDLPETQPFVPARTRLAQEQERLLAAVDGFFAREAITASLTDDDKRWMLRGVLLTRAVDNRMKQLFLSSEMKYGELGFQGKGFRSLGQEAIYAAALRLHRGPTWSRDGAWHGDVVGPLIRDLGVSLAFTDDVEMALNAQVGKSGPPSEGKDLHLGDASRGVIMVAAPLTIATCTVTGYGLAFARRSEPRVAVSFLGEGGSSLGEWHESINFAAALRLPVVFCVQNNQTALSVPVRQQTRARTFGDKALGYGIPHLSVDGTDPEAIAAAFAWAAERARQGHGPTLVETIAMRMCGHAHHDDMLYLGGDPPLGFELPPPPDKGYVDRDKYAAWATRDPLARYSTKLLSEGVVDARTLRDWQAEASARVDDAVTKLKERPWPDAALAGRGVFAVPVGAGGDRAMHPAPVAVPALPASGTRVEVAVEPAPPFDPKGQTFLDAVALGLEDVLAALPEAFVLGEDVGPPYGNAFLLLKPLVDKFGDRLLNTPLAEGAILGACVGSALAGMRPIGEIQFNDFVASGFNQLVNNAAKLHYRAGTRVPMTVRLPWGGLRRAGPYHSQDTSPWFFRTPGLKIVAPSTPHDARALMMSAVLDDDPVLYYEHIGLYRDPKIKQKLVGTPAPIPLGTAAFRRLGADLSLLAYGAYVHRALRVAETLSREDGVECDVLDLRSLSPLDWPRIEATVRRTGKVLLVGEDSRTGSILESIASRIGESLFEHLDGPVRVLGSLDTPVPYSPSLEDAFLLTEPLMLETARALVAW
jgi:2-oxoisovalerate dehydrogenase E1 component